MQLKKILTNRSVQWAIYAALVLIFLIWVYRANTQFDREKIKPISIFEKTGKEFDLKLSRLKTDKPIKTLDSTGIKDNIPDFTLDYPATWSAKLSGNTDNSSPIFVLLPLTKTDIATDAGECIKIYQSEDHMPVLEAKNYNPYMIEKPGFPYLTKEDVETVINGLEATIGRLRIDSGTPNRYVFNALLVKNYTDSYILRACEQTKDSIFYQVLKSFKLLE
jgi:hypothetical protein